MTFRGSSYRVASGLLAGVLSATSLFAGQQTSQPAYQQPFPSAQDTTPYPPPPANGNDGSWSPVGQGSQQAYPQTQQPYPQSQQTYPSTQQPYPQSAPNASYGNAPYGNAQVPYAPQYPQGQPAYQGPQQPVPTSLAVPAGTFITVRVNQVLSSDHNQPGDGFSAVLVQPLVVNGVVVAEPGQTIAGQVVEAQKAGRVEGTARLGITLTELTLVDGQQLPLHTQFVNRTGGTSVGRDAGAIATTTGLGAAIGAAAGWGTGAAIGAGAGAVAGTVGVLLTRGHASIIAPEQVLTFRIDTPVSIDTTHATQAFRYVQPNEYDRPVYNQTPAPMAYASAPLVTPAPYYYGYGYPYYYPYAYGPSFSLFFGSRYYGRPYYYGGGRGFYGGGRGFSGGGVRRR